MPPTHRLILRFSSSRSSLIVDPNTGLPTSENSGIDAQYNLVDIASNKSVLNGSTFSRVTYDMPGSYQRFARSRALRDAEDRARKRDRRKHPDAARRVLHGRNLAVSIRRPR